MFDVVRIDGNDVIVDARGALAVKKALVAHSIGVDDLREKHRTSIISEIERVDAMMYHTHNKSPNNPAFMSLLAEHRMLLMRLAGTYR